MTDNEYAATEIMGYTVEACRSLDKSYYVSDKGIEWGKVDCWLPDSNCEQRRLVEEKGGHAWSCAHRIDKRFVFRSSGVLVSGDSELAARLELARKCHRQSITEDSDA